MSGEKWRRLAMTNHELSRRRRDAVDVARRSVSSDLSYSIAPLIHNSPRALTFTHSIYDVDT